MRAASVQRFNWWRNKRIWCFLDLGCKKEENHCKNECDDNSEWVMRFLEIRAADWAYGMKIYWSSLITFKLSELNVSLFVPHGETCSRVTNESKAFYDYRITEEKVLRHKENWMNKINSGWGYKTFPSLSLRTQAFPALPLKLSFLTKNSKTSSSQVSGCFDKFQDKRPTFLLERLWLENVNNAKQQRHPCQRPLPPRRSLSLSCRRKSEPTIQRTRRPTMMWVTFSMGRY